MNKKTIGSLLLAVSICGMMFIVIMGRLLSFFGRPSDQICLGQIFLSSILIIVFTVGLILLLSGKRLPKERRIYHGDRRRCSKCNGWVDISKAKRPCVIKCKECGYPVLLDIEAEDVKVQCPKCMTQQVQHIEYRPAEVPCKECGVTLVIPKRY